MPDEAFTAVTGDVKEVAKAFKKRNRDERSGQPTLPFDVAQQAQDYATQYHKLTEIAEETPAGVRNKANAYQVWRDRKDWWHDWTSCNIWTAAFFVPLMKFDDPAVATHERLLKFIERQDSQAQMAATANALAEQLRFFHWPLEFPEVFEAGGFDVVLGNPPWDRPEFHEQIYWAIDPYIAASPNEGEREKRIDEYRHSKDEGKNRLAREYDIATHAVAAGNKFWRECGRFSLTAVGKFNIFALFAEAALSLICKHARIGIIVPTGIATDDVCNEFFADIVKRKYLRGIVSLENRLGWFPDIDSRIQFSLLTLGDTAAQPAQSWFYLLSPEEQHNPLRALKLTENDYQLLSPNTFTSPLCRTNADLELTRKLYRTNEVLLRESPYRNDFGIRIRRILNMGSSSVKTKAKTYDKLLSEYFEFQADGSFLAKGESWLPIIESKLIHQYQPRYATYEGAVWSGGKLKPREVTPAELSSSGFALRARYWFAKSAVDASVKEEWSRNWLLVFRDIARSTDERTAAMGSPYSKKLGLRSLAGKSWLNSLWLPKPIFGE